MLRSLIILSKILTDSATSVFPLESCTIVDGMPLNFLVSSHLGMGCPTGKYFKRVVITAHLRLCITDERGGNGIKHAAKHLSFKLFFCQNDLNIAARHYR